MTSQDIKQQIDNTLKASPASKPNVSVTNVEPKISDEEKQKQVLGFGSLVQQAQVASGGISQSQLERLVMPIDRSIGIAEPDYVGEPTKRVATARTLSTEGAKDYRQFEYDLDDSRGETVEGAPEDGVVLGNRGAGVASAGSVLGSTGELRDMDGSEGNPYFLKDKTPSIFKDVEPFPVSLPRYNIEAKSTTTSRAKLAYQLATAIQGEPEEYFLGYERIPESKEGFWSGLQKGISTGFTDLLTGVAKGGLFITSQASQLAHKGWGHIIGADDEWFDWAESEIENNTAEISEYIDKLNEQYARKVGGELTPDATMWASLGKSIPSMIGQLGLMMAGGPAGNWPMQIIQGGMQGQATWDAMEGLGLSPTDRNLRAIGSAVLSTILNRIGIFGLAQTQLAVTRRFATNTFKRMSSVVGQSLLGAAGEGLTELGDEVLQDMFSLNIRDDNFSQRMDNYLTSLLAGAISGLVAVPMNVRAEKVQIARERILANKLGMSASQMEKSLKKFAEAAEKVGLMSKQQAVDLAFLMSLPEAQAQMNNAIKENIDAIYDKVNPEVLKQLLSLGQDTAKQTMQDFKDLDAKVMSNLPKQMDESTKVMVSRAMRGVAAILAIKGNKDIKVPMFKYRAGESEYDPATNTVYISANPSTTTSADSFVRNGELKKISPEQRSLLHEIGHVLDVQLGTNSDYKTFLPAYFNAIATVFGKKKAGLVQKAMPKTGERVGNVKKQADYLSDKNTTEWFAYSLGRLGRQVGEALGLTGEIADYVDVANVMAQQLLIPEMQNALTEYNNAVKALIKENDDTLIAMAKAAGEKGLAEAIERYVAGDENALSKDDVKSLYKILKSFVGSEGGKILSEAFQNVSVETFMERTNREFQRSIQDAPKRGKKIGDTQLEDFGGDQGYTPQDSVALQERRVGYQATPTAQYDQPDLLHVGTGEDAIAHGWGSYWLEDKEWDKSAYFVRLGLGQRVLPLVVEISYHGDDLVTENTKTIPPAMVEDVFGRRIYDELEELKWRHEEFLDEDGYYVDRLKPNDADEYILSKMKDAGVDPESVVSVRVKIQEGYNMGQIMKALLPDEDFMIDEDRPVFQQTQPVLDAIMKISKDKFFDETGLVVDGMDRAFEWQGIDSIDDIKNRNTGETFYNLLATYYDLVEGSDNPAREASLALLEYGVEGIHYHGGIDGEGWVVFDTSKIDPLQVGRGIEGVRMLELPAFNRLDKTQALPMQEKSSGSARTPSNLERRMAAQDGMRTYDQTAKRVDEILSAPDYKPVSKFFTKVFGGYGSGDLNTYLWMISPDLQKEFDLVGGFAEAESLAMEDMSELWAATGLVSRYARNVFLNKLNQPSIKVEHLDDGMGGFEPKTLTPNQVLNIYLSAKTKSLPNTIAAFGGDEAAMRNAIDQLTPEQKQFGDNMQQFLRTKYYRNKVYTEEELMELTDTEMDELGLKEGFDVQEFLQRQDESTLYWPRLSMKYALVGDRRPNYDVARQENPDDPSSFEIPATELIGGYIYRQAAGKSGVYSKIRRIKDLFFYDPREETGNMDSKAEKVSDEVFDKSNKLRRKVSKAFGGSEKALNNFKKLLNDHLNGIHTQEIGSSLLNKISRNYIAGQLSWKPIQFVKNSMNVFMFWGLAQDQGKYWADTMWAATHWKEAKRYMIDRVPWMKTRYENAEVDEQLRQNTAASDNLLMTWAQNKELPEGMQNAVANIVAISQAAKKAGYFSMLAGDAASNIIGGYGLLKQMIETYGEAEGVRRFTQALATKQSNTNRAVKSLMQREWNRDFRGQFITFMSEPVGKTKSLAVAVERARRGEISWKDAGMEIASLTMSMVLFSLISAGIIDLWDDNEENDKEVYKALGREGISMITGFHPLGGSMIAPLVSEVFMGGQQSINTTFTSGVFKALNALSDGDWGTVAADTAGATGMLIGAGALEQFVEGWLRAPSEDEAYAESGRRMIYGETKRRAEKRAGYKEPVENEDE